MSSSENNEFFNEIQTDLKRLDEHLDSINRNLKHHNFQEISRNTGTNSLEQQFTANPSGVGAFGPGGGAEQNAFK